MQAGEKAASSQRGSDADEEDEEAEGLQSQGAEVSTKGGLPGAFAGNPALWMSMARRQARAVLARSGLLGIEDSLGPFLEARERSK